jgi:pilus assembly protein Flp/PilA
MQAARARSSARIMRKALSRFIAGEAGGTAIEYGLIAACISLALIATAQNVGSRLNTTFVRLESAIGGEVLIEPYYDDETVRQGQSRALRVTPQRP